MNREMKKTLAFVVAALVMTGAVAALSLADRSRSPEAFNDQGKKFFDDFDPTTCTTLEVFDFDPSTATMLPFKVTLKDGKWVIPSHFDYPADAKQRLIDTASGVTGLVKDRIASDRTEDQETFGVVDPLDTKASSNLKGIGKRVTLKDGSEKVLADFIIGKEVKDHADQRYVRVPGQKRTYGVKVKVDLSTRFADWIETNLLKLDVARVRKVVIDHKGFDPSGPREVPGDVITLERKDSSTPWTIEGMFPGKEPNTETLQALSTALGDVKIAGIRPKPEGLTQDLKQANGDVKLTDLTSQASWRSMISRGFYLLKTGFYSNKGTVTVETDEGVIYTLRYGEVVVATGDEFSAGVELTKEAKDLAKATEKATSKPTEGTSEGRYLFVNATFDPALIPPPKPSTDPDDKFPDDPFAYDEGETKLVAESKAAKEKAEKRKAEQDKLIADGQKRAKELSDRFAAWYYVTPGDSYRTIMQDRDKLVRDKGTGAPKPGGRPGGFPGGLPGGFPGGLGQPMDPHGD
jgi:Domain of unknown function (DUF4340)